MKAVANGNNDNDDDSVSSSSSSSSSSTMTELIIVGQPEHDTKNNNNNAKTNDIKNNFQNDHPTVAKQKQTQKQKQQQNHQQAQHQSTLIDLLSSSDDDNDNVLWNTKSLKQKNQSTTTTPPKKADSIIHTGTDSSTGSKIIGSVACRPASASSSNSKRNDSATGNCKPNYQHQQQQSTLAKQHSDSIKPSTARNDKNVGKNKHSINEIHTSPSKDEADSDSDSEIAKYNDRLDSLARTISLSQEKVQQYNNDTRSDDDSSADLERIKKMITKTTKSNSNSNSIVTKKQQQQQQQRATTTANIGSSNRNNNKISTTSNSSSDDIVHDNSLLDSSNTNEKTTVPVASKKRSRATGTSTTAIATTTGSIDHQQQNNKKKQQKINERVHKELIRQNKKISIQYDRDQKKIQQFIQKQVTGKLYQKEIAVLLDPYLYNTLSNTNIDSETTDSSTLLLNDNNKNKSSNKSAAISTNTVNFSNLSNDIKNNGYQYVYKYDSAIGQSSNSSSDGSGGGGCSIIQWIRNDCTYEMDGGQLAFNELMSSMQQQTTNGSNSNSNSNSNPYSRSNHSDNNDNTKTTYYQHIKTIAVIVHDAKEFLYLLTNTPTTTLHSNDDNDIDIDNYVMNTNNNDDINDYDNDVDIDNYPALENWIRTIQHSWQVAWKVHQNQQNQNGPRIIVFLYQAKETLRQMWIDFNSKEKQQQKTKKSKKNTTASAVQILLEQQQQQSTKVVPPTDFQLEDAITWMLIQFQVECIHCDTYDELLNHICKMTRMFGQENYQKIVTELDCKKKIASQYNNNCTTNENNNNTDTATIRNDYYNIANDCWIRQLEQIPRVSKVAAMHVAAQYPTGMKLWQTYHQNNISEYDKRILLENHLSITGTTNQRKTSEFIYRVLTSNNPNEILN